MNVMEPRTGQATKQALIEQLDTAMTAARKTAEDFINLARSLASAEKLHADDARTMCALVQNASDYYHGVLLALRSVLEDAH